MARSQFRLFLLTLAAVLALVGVRGAAAAQLTSASGTFTTTSATFNSARSADGNTIIDLSATLSYTGTFNGTSTLHGHLIFHPNGSANFRDVETFTGTVNGVPGTVTFNLTGTGRAGPTAGSFVYEGTQAIVSGTGDLANLHGVLTQVGTVSDTAAGPFGTYTGEIHFDD
jgi:hypothetical protein